MPIKVSGPDIKAVITAGVPASKVMLGTGSSAVQVWRSRPVVQITGTDQWGGESRDQFRAACTAHGTDYTTVKELPFDLDFSQATSLYQLFRDCWALTTVPQLDTSNIRYMYQMFYNCYALTYVGDLQTANVSTVTYMFQNCSSLTDGNVRLIGKKAGVSTTDTIKGSGLTRVPFFDANGNPV